MSDDEALQRRLRAVERSLTDGDHQVDALRDAGTQADRIEKLENQLADAEDRIAELEATTQALRGYVGNVRSVNEDVEQRADAALAAVERLEQRFDDATQPVSGTTDTSVHSPGGRPVRSHSPDQREQDTRSERRRDGDDSDSGDGGDSGGNDDSGLIARVRSAF